MIIAIGTYRNDLDMITRCVESLTEHVVDMADHQLVFIDDSDIPDESEWSQSLQRWGKRIWRYGEQPWGAVGAMKLVTNQFRYWQNEGYGDYFCFWEEDCRAVAPIDLGAAAAFLKAHPLYAQFAFARQPTFDEEKAAGSVGAFLAAESLDCMKHKITDCWGDGIATFYQQRACFTGNPSVWAPCAYEQDWPQVPGHEREKTWQLTGRGLYFAYSAEQLISHDGERQGHGY